MSSRYAAPTRRWWANGKGAGACRSRTSSAARPCGTAWPAGARLSRGPRRRCARSAGSGRRRRREQVADAQVGRPARRPDLAPCAVRRVLVRAKTDEPRSVAEAVPLELGAPLLQRQLVQRLALPAEYVEGDELRGNLRGQLADPALCRMPPQLHRVEVQHAVALDHDLAVERRVRRQELAELSQLREVAEQRPGVAAPDGELALG